MTALLASCLLAASAIAGESAEGELRALAQGGSNPYQYKGKASAIRPDRAALERLKSAADPRIRLLAEQRLRIESLKETFIQTNKNAAGKIGASLKTNASGGELAKRVALQAAKQAGQEDASLDDVLVNAFRGQLQDFHDLSMTEHQKIAQAGLDGLEAEKAFRKGIEALLSPREPAVSLQSAVAFSFSSNAQRRDVRFRVQNNTRETLHNCIVVLDVHSDPTLYRKEELAGEIVAGGLMAQFGFDPTQDAKLSRQIRVNSVADRGGFAFVPAWEPGASILIDVDSAGRFVTRVSDADLTFACDEFCFKDRDVPLKAIRETIRKQYEAAVKAAARKAAHKRQQQSQSRLRRTRSRVESE